MNHQATANNKDNLQPVLPQLLVPLLQLLDCPATWACPAMHSWYACDPQEELHARHGTIAPIRQTQAMSSSE